MSFHETCIAGNKASTACEYCYRRYGDRDATDREITVTGETDQ